MVVVRTFYKVEVFVETVYVPTLVWSVKVQTSSVIVYRGDDEYH